VVRAPDGSSAIVSVKVCRSHNVSLHRHRRLCHTTAIGLVP
jgi:hypothetical protein